MHLFTNSNFTSLTFWLTVTRFLFQQHTAIHSRNLVRYDIQDKYNNIIPTNFPKKNIKNYNNSSSMTSVKEKDKIKFVYKRK